MTAGPASAVARVRSTLARSDDPRTDGQLLAAFRDARDPDAFTALVYRHGPRVLGVCRRITGHDHDADDACQAVFLVLARRAADVRPPDGVGAWLYGVAFRTAQDARVMSARRRAKVAPTADLPDVPTEPPAPDLELAAALDAEIARLPESHRAAVVLCELDGLPRKDAAARLGIAEGTLSSRLAAARKRLAGGLKRKGFALPAVLATAIPASGSESVFPLACRLGQLAAAGEQLPAGVPVALADVVTRVMFLTKLKVLGAVAVCALLLLVAGWMTFGGALADDPKPQPKAQPVKPAPQPPLNKMVLWKQSKAVVIDADGKNEKVLFELAKFEGIRDPKLSPDGKRIAYTSHVVDPAKLDPAARDHRAELTLWVRDIDGTNAVDLKTRGGMAAWSPDGKELLVTDVEDRPNNGPKDGPPKATAVVVELATKKETILPLPPGHIATAFAPDGKKVVTTVYDISTGKPLLATYLVSRDGKDVTAISDPTYLAMFGRLSPDGKSVLFMGMKAPDKVPDRPIDQRARLFVQPVGGKPVELSDVPLNAEVSGYCWSPDGKQIAYTWRTVHKDKAEDGKPDERETESFLCVCDADGKNHRTLLSEKGMGQYHVTLGSVDWR